MHAIEKITNKVREISLGSRQNLVTLLHKPNRLTNPFDQTILDDLRKEGVHMTSVERLFGEASEHIMNTLRCASSSLDIADELHLPSHLQRMTSSVDLLSSHILSEYPELYLLGLSQRILDLVDNYLKLPAAYHGVALRRSLVDGREEGPRLWHLDGEDFHVFRIVIYLTDVAEGGGPFEYIPRSYDLTYKDLKTIDSRIKSADMLKVVPKNVIRQCYGKAGTVILCDTGTTFHHEKLQTAQARSVAMFGFSSRIPSNLQLAKRHFPVEALKEELKQLLSPIQIPYVFGWRG
ncbi:MAG: hypothetical protein IPN42_12750 [Methylococcaceae bacterium]|nr:hypothetical protein [Methylococcaceae bacterium]